MSSYFNSAFVSITRPFRKPTEEEKRKAARQNARIRFVTHNYSPTRKRSRSRGGRRTKHRSRK